MDFFTNENIIFYLLAYLIGSIPFGLILAKTFAGVDIKNDGSRSIGATNVLRVVKKTNPSLAKKLGIATVILDALKGTILLLAGMFIFNLSEQTLWAMAVLSVLGHCYSIYLGLEGWKRCCNRTWSLYCFNSNFYTNWCNCLVYLCKSFKNIIFIFTFGINCSNY